LGLCKFAPWLENGQNLGAGETIVRGDPILLPFGQFLRKRKVNKTPQLWHIFVGEMSVVRPRPMVLNTNIYYCEAVRQKLDAI